MPILLIRIALLLLARDAARIPFREGFDRDTRRTPPQWWSDEYKGHGFEWPTIAVDGRDMVLFCRCINEFQAEPTVVLSST